MADVTYLITIRDERGGDSKGLSEGNVAPSTDGTNASGNPNGTVAGSKRKGSGEKARALALVAAKKIIHRVATTYINQVGVRTGNTQLQERLSYSYSCLERSIGIGIAVVGGAMTGNVLAVAAGVGAAVTWGVNIAVAQEQINLQRSVENIGIAQANIRAGAGGDRSGRATY